MLSLVLILVVLIFVGLGKMMFCVFLAGCNVVLILVILDVVDVIFAHVILLMIKLLVDTIDVKTVPVILLPPDISNAYPGAVV